MAAQARPEIKSIQVCGFVLSGAKTSRRAEQATPVTA
jgi:hypothetical protein